MDNLVLRYFLQVMITRKSDHLFIKQEHDIPQYHNLVVSFVLVVLPVIAINFQTNFYAPAAFFPFFLSFKLLKSWSAKQSYH